MSNMGFSTKSYAGDVQIISRGDFEAKAMTLDFSSVTAVDVNGVKVVKAGTPIGSTGVVDNTATVVGILLHDVTIDCPQGALVQKGYINETKAEASSGLTYADAMKSALKQIIFE